MIYSVIGIMSGSSLDGLDIAFTEFTETGGKWSYDIIKAACLPYNDDWKQRLSKAMELSAIGYLQLHADYGHYIGNAINEFIEVNNLHHKVNLIASHGHTVFHFPNKKMTAQLGDGAAIAAVTKLPVVSDLRSVDVAFGGQGAPIVPIGEKLLMADFGFLLNIGGIANLSINKNGNYTAFDVCPANSILNLLISRKNLLFDDKGKIAASGKVDDDLLLQLNNLAFYQQPLPKSLDNSYAITNILPLIKNANLTIENTLCTYVEHIAQQIKIALISNKNNALNNNLLITGGGAFNTFLIERIRVLLAESSIITVLPNEKLICYKEAMIMGLMGVLRWREEANVLASVTGATLNSIGGALWLGTEA